MRLLYFVHFQKFKFAITIFLVVVFIILSVIFLNYRKLPEGSVRKFNRQAESLNLEPLKIGGDIPLKPELYRPETPKDVFLVSKFYINIAEPNLECFSKNCNSQAAMINTMGGWIEAEKTGMTVDEIFGLDLEENKNIKSVVIIGDKNGKIVGIYPNKKSDDAISILKFYPELADFNLLKGVDKFYALKIGDLSPLKPNDFINHLSGDFEKFSLRQIPQNKKFYFYSLQKNNSVSNYYFCEKESGCKYLEFADDNFDLVKDEQSWFLVNSADNMKMIELFGLNSEDVLNGKISLVVVTDSDGIIRALHPGKTISDLNAILSQLLFDLKI